MEDALVKRVLPHSIESEQSVIGSMLYEEEAIATAMGILKKDDFYQTQYGIIFETITELYQSGRKVDLVTLQNALKEKDVAPEVYSLEALKELMNSVFTAANVQSYANIVAEKAQMRRMIKTFENLTDAYYLGKEKPANLLNVTEKQIFDLLDKRRDNNHEDIRTITMGISLLDCADSDPAACARKIYDKICRSAEKLVSECCEIETEFGIPINDAQVNCRDAAVLSAGLLFGGPAGIIAGLIGGGRLFVNSATQIATILGVSEKFIAITILAGGTSLPELVTCVIAAAKGKGQLALGNILGSNIFNILLIIGCAAVVRPISMANMNWVDMAALLVSALFIMLISNRGKIDRRSGIALLCCEIAYMTYLITTL